MVRIIRYSSAERFDILEHLLDSKMSETDNFHRQFGLMEEISLFVEENCEADILDETREIR